MKWVTWSAMLALSILFVGTMGRERMDDEDAVDVEDDEDDFAEFDFDDEDDVAVEKRGKAKGDVEEAAVVDDEDEDEELDEQEIRNEKTKNDVVNDEFDDDEFEGYSKDALVDEDDEDEFEHDTSSVHRHRKERQKKDDERFKQTTTPTTRFQPLKMSDVPLHLRNHWESYSLEMLVVLGIVVYFINFFIGKSSNQRIANAWIKANQALLEANFAMVGDDNSVNNAKNDDNEEDNSSSQPSSTPSSVNIDQRVVKESESHFLLWCSGRSGCEGMLVTIKLVKRQDLLSLLMNLMRVGSASSQSQDQVELRVHMNKDEMDSFVFCLASKKSAGKMSKELNDLSLFCPEKKSPGDKFGLPNKFVVMAEMAEITSAILDPRVVAMLDKFENNVDSIHISDQYTGAKPSDDQVPSELPEGRKVLIFTFNLSKVDGASASSLDSRMDELVPLLQLVFYMLDKVRRFKLSREAKNKAEKNRSRMAEAFWKSIHASRAEKAQEERERKKREMKERIRDMDDPERQRKLEEKELRRERKKAQPRLKQLKTKF